jgi:hypothetical protein
MLSQVASTVAVLALCNVATAFMAPASGRVSLKPLEARTPLIAGTNLTALQAVTSIMLHTVIPRFLRA